MLIGITPPGSQAILDTSLFFPSRNFTAHRRRLSTQSRVSAVRPLVCKGKLKLDELVTRRYALEQINEAVDDLNTAESSAAQ